MNKYVKIFGIVAVIGGVALAGAAAAFAQSATPTSTPAPFGPGGMMGGYGGGMMGGYSGLMSEYRDLMHAPIAEALGMTLDEFNAALAEGQTPYTLAQEKGVDTAKLQTAMQTGMADALKQAVKDGKLTQAQADQMLARHAQMQAWHAQSGNGRGMMGGGYGGGMMGGRGRGNFGSSGFNGNCPHLNTPTATPAPTN
jgi:hypothetical protein